jgi:CDP-glycerol glycerophosphotransferase (TagB/SpsB family)
MVGERKMRFASPAHNAARVFRAIPLSIGYLIGRFIPRRRELWVFGNLIGFQDNPRYLLEYMRETHPEIRTVWLASTQHARDEARSLGYDSHLIGSFAGLTAALRASTGIICMRLADVNRAAIGGMFVVNTWHGSPLKRVLLDAPIEWGVSRGRLGRWLGRVSRWLIARAHREVSLVTAPSATVQRRFESAFGLPASKIAISGYSRDDIILGLGAPVHEELGLPPSARLVLYAPTWREAADQGRLWEGFDRETWETLLESANAYLIIKLHPHTPIEEVDYLVRHPSRILLATSELSVLRDVNRVLPCIDVLITDYSSVAFDFSLLERPIVFFAPDYEEYKQARDFYEPYELISGGRHTLTWKDLWEAIKYCLEQGGDSFIQNARALKARYNAYCDGRSRERIVEAILSQNQRKLRLHKGDLY